MHILIADHAVVEASSFGERDFTRVRYGSIRITVLPFVISQPAVPN